MVSGCKRDVCYNKNCAKYKGASKHTTESAKLAILQKLKSQEKIQICLNSENLPTTFNKYEIKKITEAIISNVRKQLNILHTKLIL